jgi:dGTPase
MAPQITEQPMTENIEQALSYRAPNFAAPKPDAGVGKEAFSRDTRQPYQRDLGRIIHSASFRRLQTKTQVMGTGEGDFHRTRLTHSLEVGQIGRGIVWNLLERDEQAYHKYLPSSELIEAICYAHDLGHPPFGHGGERALHQKMKEYGGFEGNAQTIRILTRLEKYYRGAGIQPTRRLLLGVLKYPAPYGDFEEKAKGKKPPKCYYDEDRELIDRALACFSEKDVKQFRSLNSDGKPIHKTFDCSIMELADDIAYGVHDLEDGVGRGVLPREQVEQDLRKGFEDAGVFKIRDISVLDLIDKLFSDDTYARKHAISLLVGYFIVGVEVVRLDEFESGYLGLRATVPAEMRKLLDHLSKEITFKSIVRRREVQTLEFKGEKIISDLFNAFSGAPLSLIGKSGLTTGDENVVKILEKADKDEKAWYDLPDPERSKVARSICDFIAGMTNPYAEKYHRRLFEPGFGSSTDEL